MLCLSNDSLAVPYLNAWGFNKSFLKQRKLQYLCPLSPLPNIVFTSSQKLSWDHTSHIEERIEFKIFLPAYQCLHGTAPSYLREMLKECVPPQKKNMKTYGGRSFSVPQNYEISFQILSGQLGVWQSSNDNWTHICSKMYISNN